MLTAVKANAVAFHIPAGQQVCKPPPKRFCNQQNVGRENVSLNQLAEKQKIAEARKNVSAESGFHGIFGGHGVKAPVQKNHKIHKLWCSLYCLKKQQFSP